MALKSNTKHEQNQIIQISCTGSSLPFGDGGYAVRPAFVGKRSRGERRQI